MSITNKLKEVTPMKSGRTCSMCSVLQTLDPQDRDAINEALLVPTHDHGRVSDRQLAQILKSEGYDVGINSVYRHRANHMGIQ